MKDGIIVNGISEETLAAYFDGTATADEYKLILETLGESDELDEIMSISMAVDRDLALGMSLGAQKHTEILPISAAAAAMSNNSCACSVECERYILKRRGIEYDEERIAELAKEFNIEFDETGSIGKRYRRQDEIGTPFCITYDFESATDGCVTVRDRDTMEQKRMTYGEFLAMMYEALEF